MLRSPVLCISRLTRGPEFKMQIPFSSSLVRERHYVFMFISNIVILSALFIAQRKCVNVT